MTHAELVERAARWLRNSRGCGVVVTRACVWTTEQPDALGWNATGASLLVECKASRADFLRDRKKPHRKYPGKGMGNYRYYLTPPGLVGLEELPEGWGLLECGPRSVRLRRRPVWVADKNRAEEIRHLLAHLRRGRPAEGVCDGLGI